MATYYNYAERSADSQINWAEVGKDMSDMLKNENRIREEKKAAIDASSREFGKMLSQPPQGEHKGANQWALEYADNASKYMLMQDKLLKSGQMKLKDYTVARQNILDGTEQAFNLTKEYQSIFAEKMARYKKGDSQDLEQWVMAQAEGYSDFNKSQLYINPTNGTVSVAMKEKKNVDGNEVYVMSQNPNQFTSISTLRNQIAGKYDKFNTNVVTDAFVKGLGTDITSAIAKTASLSSGGLIETVEDIRRRKDIDPATKEILYKFSDSENQFIKSVLVNPYDRLSVLTNSKKFAPNGLQYGFTYDEKEAKANPNKILLKVDPSSGQPTPQFSDEQMKVSEDFIRTELRAKYTSKQELKATPQNQLQERRPPTSAEIDQQNMEQDSKNLAQNLAYLIAGDTTQVQPALSYLSQKTGKLFERTKDGIIVSNADGTNRSVFNFRSEGGSLVDSKTLGRSIIGAIKTNVPEDMIVKNYDLAIKADPVLNYSTTGKGFETPTEKPKSTVIKITPDLFTVQSVRSTERLKSLLPNGFKVEDKGGFFGNDVQVIAPNGKTYTYNANLSSSKVESEKDALEKFINMNNVPLQGSGSSTVTGGNVR